MALHYITLLFAACLDIHDYASQLTSEGGWLYGYYDRNISAELMLVEMEKHLALTRYLKSIIRNQSEPYSGDLYDVSELNCVALSANAVFLRWGK